MLWQILLYTAVGSVVSLSGGILLLLKGKTLTETLSKYLVSFAVGVLLSVSFLDLLPEAVEAGAERNAPIFAFALAGMLVFFLLERSLLWYHHHHSAHGGIKPTVLLMNIGDSLHNFIDGIAIGATFLADPSLGIATAIAVALHEIPQEISDFAVMLSSGMSRKYVLTINILSACVSFAGAIGIYLLGSQITTYLPEVVGFTAGMFIYIAGSDLMPTLHEKIAKKEMVVQSILIFMGVVSVSLLRHYFER